MKVFFVYGFIEGRWHSKRFRRALRKRGYDVGRSLKNADVIIAHSGGCYDVPPLRDDQLLVLINPPYWPERSVRERTWNMAKQMIITLKPGRHALYSARKTVRNLIYSVTRRRHNKRIAERTRTFRLVDEVRHSRTILVRNNNDPWLTPNLTELQKANPHLHIERLAGDHDDCWIKPNLYIDLIESYRS